MWGGGQLARFMSTLLNFLILLLPADLGAEESFDPFVFFESIQVYDETIIMESRSGIGKLPAGMNDSRENTTYGKRQIYSAATISGRKVASIIVIGRSFQSTAVS